MQILLSAAAFVITTTLAITFAIYALRRRDLPSAATPLILGRTTPFIIAALLGSTGCLDVRDSESDMPGDGSENGETEQAVFSGSYLVEPIDSYLFGYQPVFPALIIDDSSSLGWMCGYDASAPPDKIYEWYYVMNAYAHHSNLAVTPKDAFGTCLTSSTSTFLARVYSDNSIRMCVGGTRYSYCDKLFTPSYTSLGMAPNP